MLMYKLIIEHNEQQVTLNLRHNKTYIVSKETTADIKIDSLEKIYEIKEFEDGSWQCNHHELKNSIYFDDQYGGIKFRIYDTRKAILFEYPDSDMMTIGSEKYDDISLHTETDRIVFKGITSIQENGEIRCDHRDRNHIYHNYELVTTPTFYAKLGDHIVIGDTWLEVRETGLVVLSYQYISSELIAHHKDVIPTAGGTNHNDYHRSPRIIHREPTETIKIEKPPQPVQKNNNVIWRSIIPPMVMIALTVVIFLVRPIGVYILMMIGMSTVTIIFGITTYFQEKKKYKVDVKKRKEDYTKYLKDKTSQIYKAIELQRFSLNFHYPKITELSDIILTRAPRIYEKTNHHHDFLHYRIGTANIDKSFDVDYQEEEFNQRRDELFDEAKGLSEHYEKIEQAPLINDLNNGPVAYVGPRHLIMESLQNMMLQLATFHSYHDLELLAVIKEDEYEKFEWAKWLPHTNIKAQNIRSFVYNQRTRDQILTSMYSLIKERIQYTKEVNHKDGVLFTPHMVFIISDMSLVLDHVILEYINQDLTEYGISLIFVEDVIESLPEHVETIIDIRSKTEGILVLKNGELQNIPFTIDVEEDVNKELIARRLANLKHIQHMKNSIPDSVTFLEMYEVENVEALSIKKRWQHNETYKTMAVPLGLRGKDDVLTLNLHEKAHGPHGLVAGTTGSGKSEVIQSYILSLAVNFHPHEIAFLLIDYKGGGMANLFKDLPHLVGTITNLDGDEAMRALTSIKAELRKRQRLFGEYDVNHINQYHKLFKENVAKEPMPHLFIISDEFAELKSEQPDFMKELVSTARIGRSLGIHLILATQKPSGVVDDQIWSNSKFKLALKVQDRQDSNEILKTSDAADITLPGRAYLQVGNNEVYELFQSAWSGAPYDTVGDYLEAEDQTIYWINDYGQLEAINKDLSGLESTESKESETELEVVIKHIEDITKDMHIEPVKRPWLPPLPQNIYQSELIETDFKKLWSHEMKEVELTLGLKDVPEEQYQGPLKMKVKDSGHIALIGSPGYGRTTFLHNIIFNLARHHRPDQLHMYLFDFGTNGLMPITDIPHVADYFTVDQEEKINKAIKRIESLINDRKRMLSEERVVNLDQYNQYTGKNVPHIFIIIDNFDTVKESDFVDSFEMMMAKLTREGLALGMYVVITGSRSNAIRSTIYTNIKTKMALYLFDNSEITNIIGSYKKGVKDTKGRAVINDENFTQYQIAQSIKVDQEETYNEAVNKEVQDMISTYDGALPKGIPMMPDEVTEQTIEDRIDVERLIREEHKLPLGLDFEDVEVVSLDMRQTSIVSCLKPADHDQLIWNILFGLNIYKNSFTVINIDADQSLERFKDYTTSYYCETEDLVKIKLGFRNEVNHRKASQADLQPKIILINNVQNFINKAGLNEEDIKLIFSEAPKVKIFTIVSGLYNEIFNNFNKEIKMIRQIIEQGVIGNQISEQDFIKTKFVMNEPTLKSNEMYYISNHEYIKIKLFK